VAPFLPDTVYNLQVHVHRQLENKQWQFIFSDNSRIYRIDFDNFSTTGNTNEYLQFL